MALTTKLCGTALWAQTVRGHAGHGMLVRLSTLETMLVDAAFGTSGARRFVQPTVAMRVAAGLARGPNFLAFCAGGLGPTSRA